MIAVGPLSNRVRALFMTHTRTGNPLVDSVAEHNPTSPDNYWRYLDACCYAAPLGAIRYAACPRRCPFGGFNRAVLLANDARRFHPDRNPRGAGSS